MFPRIRKFLLLLKIKREVSKMALKVKLTDFLAIADSMIAIAEKVAGMTTTTKDDEVVKSLKAYREMVRPIFGSEGTSEDLPQAVADVVAVEAGKVELIHEES
jgi:hypothetical protein